MAPGNWTHRRHQLLDQGSQKKLEMPLPRPRQLGLQGPRPWGLCFLGQDIGYIHPCVLGTCVLADMEDYKRNVLTPVGYPTWEQFNTIESIWASRT